MSISLTPDVTGRVIRPDDPRYDAARAVFYGGLNAAPAMILRAAGADDVVNVIRAAADTGAELAVRSGGHSISGHSTSDGGVVLDLRDMKRLDVDVPRRIAWADAGLTAGEYTTAVGEHGLATGFGDTGSVGIGGITLGGGVGFLVRKHGLTIDSLVAAEIVTADGRLLYVDDENEPDLFWAIRGGGGNFGVVTRFCFRLHEVPEVTAGMMLLPATPEVLESFVAEAQAAPEDLSVIANVMPCPPMPFLPEELHGRPVVFALVCHAGPAADGERALSRLRGVANPLADLVTPGRYPDLYPPEDNAYHPTAVSRTGFARGLDGATAGTIVERITSYDAPMRVVQVRVLGGAMARVPADATAFAHRAEPLMVNVAAFYAGPEERGTRDAWVEQFAADLPLTEAAAYVNFIGREADDAWIRAAYPDRTRDRLVQVKNRYDPGNLFRRNHNVRPSG